MALIAHLSDVHFGAHDKRVVAASEAWLRENAPDLVIISGDLTQRARIRQFKDASAYLDRLRAAGLKVLTVPGNHDVPLYDVARRLFSPLRRYRRYIDTNLNPWFENDEVAVLGINTARSIALTGGRINRTQMRIIEDRFRDVAPQKTRILVTHHPLFAMPIGKGERLSEAVGRHESAVAALARAGVHLALAGHFHRTFAEAASRMVETAGHALVVQAGTATSVRLRAGERQSFNWLDVRRHNDLELQVISWDGTGFQPGSRVHYTYADEGWRACPLRAETERGQAARPAPISAT
ncbi:metallophosphoesterase family protein [Pedomonas mirosovicensis]|uniref:metallophosphoesterase family protein n=1 Tax=Pedomonas mirosovicensis TaxID=2908641 RepID=UPI00216A70C5|nr:metallophosphoesterase [Pedomonas mirosovicensis]MCH8684993.1 metallophosphoesterase [Pedomonas mirosovicensis]